MKLTEKEFIKADGTAIKLTPEWISSRLGEVYELSYFDKTKGERLHYGYMTEALVSFLETTDGNGIYFFERIKFDCINTGYIDFILLNQRVIFDKPSKIRAESFYSNFYLEPITYSNEKKINDITIKVHSYFMLSNKKGDLELYFNNNIIELDFFLLQNLQDIKAIYNFNFEDNNADLIFIGNMNGTSWTNNKLLDNIDLAFEAKKGAAIKLKDSAINMMVNDREIFTFNPIKVGSHFFVEESQITFDRESLKNREVELDVDSFYLEKSSISFEGGNSQKVGLYARETTTFYDSCLTCVGYSVMKKNFNAQIINNQTQKTAIRIENATINASISYCSDVKYSSSSFEIINSKIENKGNELTFLANGININNSTIKNTLSLTNALIHNADIDNLILENKGKDHDSFLVQTSTVNGDKKSQGRITLDNCIVNVDNRFSINIYGNFSASNSNFFGTNIFCSALEDSNFLFLKGDVNLDINIVNSSFKNVELYAAGLLSNKEWEDPDYRQTLTICGSELTGENELRETTLVLHSALQNVSLANASEIKNSFLKEIIKNYKMPTIIEEVNLAANEPKKDVGKVNNELEIL